MTMSDEVFKYLADGGKITIKKPFKATECSWCDEMFDIDEFSDNACSCDQIFYLCCLEKDCTNEFGPISQSFKGTCKLNV